MKYRYETFGGIIASEDPPFLAYVDRQFMREQGLEESPLWSASGQQVGLLSAPTEVHLAATNRCPVGCDHCYMDAGSRAAGELDGPTFGRALELLARLGVFHLALGGGEALAREDIFELAARARQLGMVPNLTISGALMTPQLARRIQGLFGQVNVSVDGVGPWAGAFRDPAQQRQARAAIRMLVEAGVPTGINCVLGRRNFDGLEQLFAQAADWGVNEVELLRLKPSGRAGRSAARYLRQKTTHQQNVALTPLLAGLSQAAGLTAKIDCSLVPMMCFHDPPPDLLEATATHGCEAANVLLGIDSEGTVRGCSFLQDAGFPLWELPQRWAEDEDLQKLRDWARHAPEPCASCDHLQICKGGCHAVAAFVTGDPGAPDPDCPRVFERRRMGTP